MEVLSDLATVLPLCVPFEVGPFAVGVLAAVILRFRREVYDFLVNLKDGNYGDFHVAVLVSLPVYAAFTVLGRVLVALVPWIPVAAAVLTALYLVVDSFLRRAVYHPLQVRTALMTSVVQGAAAPDYSVFALLFPLLLVQDVRWREALFFSVFLSLVYLSGAFINLTPDIPSMLLGFVMGAFFLSLLYHADEYFSERDLRIVYGVFLILLCSLVH